MAVCIIRYNIVQRNAVMTEPLTPPYEHTEYKDAIIKGFHYDSDGDECGEFECAIKYDEFARFFEDGTTRRIEIIEVVDFNGKRDDLIIALEIEFKTSNIYF